MWEPKTESIRFESACPGRETVGYFFDAEGLRPKAVVQISHGMCEYIGRYADFASFLVKHGFAVCGNDHLGHGETGKLAGEYGFFAERDGRTFVLRDLKTMNELARKRWPGVPVILLGHSMGSFFARWFATVYPDAQDALILSGTGGPNPAAGAGIAVAKLLVRVQGAHARSSLLKKLAFGTYLNRIKAPRTPHDWITRDEAIVDAYAADPWCTYTFTNSAMLDLMACLNEVSGQDWADRMPKKLPVYLIAGEEDPVGDYGKGVRTVYGMLQKAGVERLELKLYPGARHEMLNETNRAEVYDDLLAWCETTI